MIGERARFARRVKLANGRRQAMPDAREREEDMESALVAKGLKTLESAGIKAELREPLRTPSDV